MNLHNVPAKSIRILIRDFRDTDFCTIHALIGTLQRLKLATSGDITRSLNELPPLKNIEMRTRGMDCFRK